MLSSHVPRLRNRAPLRRLLPWLGALFLSSCVAFEEEEEPAPEYDEPCTIDSGCQVTDQLPRFQPPEFYPCDAIGEVVCSGDKEDILRCDGEYYRPVGQCPNSQPCVNINAHDSYQCGTYLDTDIVPFVYAFNGQPCAHPEGAAACASDQKSVLDCKGGYWVLGTPCAASTTCRQLNADFLGCL